MQNLKKLFNKTLFYIDITYIKPKTANIKVQKI